MGMGANGAVPQGLCPCQEQAAGHVERVLEWHPVIQLRSNKESGEGLRPGAGMTVLFRALESRLPSCKLLGIKDTLHAPGGEGGGKNACAIVFEAAVAAWDGGANVVILDDLDLTSGQRTIYSNRFSSSGESQGFNRTDASATILLKALADYASANGKRLIFKSIEDHFLRFSGLPYVVHLGALREQDYRFFLDAWLPAPAASAVDAKVVFNSFPALTPSELRVACVPGEGEGPMTTEQLVANVTDRLGESHGALPLNKVEKMDLGTMTGLDDVLDTLETQVVAPFEHYMKPESGFAAPKAGVLLFGPPGTGKTSIGRALAHRLKGKMFMVKEIFLYKQLVETFAKAEANAPSIIFFDDIDVLLHRHKVAWGGGEIFRFLLSKLDGMTSMANKNDNKKFVTIIMTCESPKSLPDALIRSGRIELWLKMEYPKAKQRVKILEKLLADEGEQVSALSPASVCEAEPKFIRKLADRTEDFSPADLRRVVKDARNLLAAKAAKSEAAAMDQGGEEKARKALTDAVEDLRKMRDEVESFMKQMYQ